ncbi:alpha/beta hydrolase domain-containing protein [Neobacillus sp. NRS-1170]|uniref:alpha/beta hydrolase domain-containing protein n=1 Tax=Neobacillus sp. NRS-1170 TaxID=3233898 RepID=UPI003D274B52
MGNQTRLEEPSERRIGGFGGIEYMQYDGIFSGHTSKNKDTFRVPYRITAPVYPEQGNQTVLVEPPHFNTALGSRVFYLGEEFLFSRGFSHAGVGWSTTTIGGRNGRILDPNVPGVFINGGFNEGDGQTDDEIISEFAKALKIDPIARRILGDIEQRYITGFSDSSHPVLRLIADEHAKGVFDFALPFIASGHDPQAAISGGLFDGKVIVVTSEFEGASSEFVDRSIAMNQYRLYAIAGSPHIPDHLVFASLTPSNRKTPASYSSELRTHFLQGDNWVRIGIGPPLSHHLLAAVDGTLVKDGNGNAISVNASGHRVPRLPFVELGEAHYIVNVGIGNLLGTYENVKTIQSLGFNTHNEYLNAFREKLTDYLDAGYILKEEAEKMFRRATLFPPLTYTETYLDHYENFVDIIPKS